MNDTIHSLTQPKHGDDYTCKRCGGSWPSVMQASRVPCPGEKKSETRE